MREVESGRSVLTLAVPTYKRSGSLARLLHCLEMQAGIERVEILISDNGSPDDTLAVAKGFSSRLNVRLTGFEINQGFDKNYYNCMAQATSDYVWIMGDDDILTTGAIHKMLATIESTQADLIITNGADVKSGHLVPRIGYEVGSILNVLDAMNAIGWHLCWIGTTVLKRAIFNADLINDNDYNAFIHLPILIKSMAKSNSIVYLNDVMVQTTVNNSDYFRDPEALVRTFGKQLFETLACLGNTPVARSIRKKTVRAFHDRLDMFDLKFFLRLRMNGLFSLRTFRKNVRYLYRLNAWFPAFVAFYLVPPFLLKVASTWRKQGPRSNGRPTGT